MNADSDASPPRLFRGARVRMSVLGRERHPKYGDRQGVIVVAARRAVGGLSSTSARPSRRSTGTTSNSSLNRRRHPSGRPATRFYGRGVEPVSALLTEHIMRGRRWRPSVSLPVAAALSLLVAGCSSLPRTPHSATDASTARVLDLTDLRRYADEPASTFRSGQNQVVLRGPRTYLALSGGGRTAPMAPACCNGWTEAGTRPSFSMVSGVSTGALIAPSHFSVPTMTRPCVTSTPAASPRACSMHPIRSTRSLVRACSATRGYASWWRSISTRPSSRLSRSRTREGADAVRRHDQPGLPADRHLGHGTDRFAAYARSTEPVPGCCRGFGESARGVSADAGDRGGERQALRGDACRWRRHRACPDIAGGLLLRDATFARAEKLQLYVLINNKIEREFQVIPNSTIETLRGRHRP